MLILGLKGLRNQLAVYKHGLRVELRSAENPPQASSQRWSQTLNTCPCFRYLCISLVSVYCFRPLK